MLPETGELWENTVSALKITGLMGNPFLFLEKSVGVGLQNGDNERARSLYRK